MVISLEPVISKVSNEIAFNLFGRLTALHLNEVVEGVVVSIEERRVDS